MIEYDTTERTTTYSASVLGYSNNNVQRRTVRMWCHDERLMMVVVDGATSHAERNVDVDSPCVTHGYERRAQPVVDDSWRRPTLTFTLTLTLSTRQCWTWTTRGRAASQRNATDCVHSQHVTRRRRRRRRRVTCLAPLTHRHTSSHVIIIIIISSSSSSSSTQRGSCTTYSTVEWTDCKD